MSIFGKFAALTAKKLKKGDSATVSGELRQDRWETEDGNRSKVYVVAREIDSEGYFRAAEENADLDAAPAATEAAPAEAPAEEAKAKDDIPF